MGIVEDAIRDLQIIEVYHQEMERASLALNHTSSRKPTADEQAEIHIRRRMEGDRGCLGEDLM